MYHSYKHTVYTFVLIKSTLHAEKQSYKTGCLKSAEWNEKSHLNRLGINTFCTPDYTLSDPSTLYTTADFHFSTVHQAQLCDTFNVEGVKSYIPAPLWCDISV